MKSSIIKRSVVFNGHKTSVSLEDAFWNSLKEIAEARASTTTFLQRSACSYWTDSARNS